MSIVPIVTTSINLINQKPKGLKKMEKVKKELQEKFAYLGYDSLLNHTVNSTVKLESLIKQVKEDIKEAETKQALHPEISQIQVFEEGKLEVLRKLLRIL